MTSWLRKNAIALAAVVVLAPTTIGVTVANDWGSYLSERPSQPVEVAADHSARFAGAGWRVESVERFGVASDEGVEAELPTGTQLVAVTVQVSPKQLDDGGRSAGCTVRLLEDPRSGTDQPRSWGAEGFSPLSSDFTNGIESGCNPQLDTDYRFTSYFILPEDVDDDLALQVQVADELPRFLLFRL